MSRRRSREETTEEVETVSKASRSRGNDAEEAPTGRRRVRENASSRKIVDAEDEEEEEEKEEEGDDHVHDIFQFGMERRYMEDYQLSAEGSKTETSKWNKISVHAQELCIKTIARLFILKGSKNEVITTSHIGDALGALDTTYKGVKGIVLARVQEKLERSFGYIVVSSDCIVGCGEKTGTNKDFYLTTKLTSRKLWMELTKVNKDSGYGGFIHVVFQSIFMSTGKKILCKDLLTNIRLLDPRFPAFIVKTSTNKNIIPELGDDFLGLLGRMKKEKYIEEVKESNNANQTVNDLLEVFYTFGPRFHIELGLVELAKSMFTFNNEPIDAEFVTSIQEENEEDEAEEI
jgi:hypothetical protein